MRGVVVTAAMMLGAVTVAQAADMPDLPILRGSFTDGLTTARVNWEGVYAGGQGDWGSAVSNIPPGFNNDMQNSFMAPNAEGYRWGQLGPAHNLSTGFGAFAGYNSQWEDVVVGIEANYMHEGFRANSNATGITFAADQITVLDRTNTSATVKLTDFGSLRLRGGYVIGCFMPYIFFGGGVGNQVIERNVFASPAPINPQAWFTDSSSKLVYGYTAGAGFDVMLVGGLFARAEYEYRRITASIDSNVNTLHLGLGYKF
jgi:outer membrane immunogenic protein